LTERETKRGIRELSPLDVYRLLPRTNCEECGEKNCMAFAAKVVNREVSIEECPPLLEEKYRSEYDKLSKLLAPAVKEVSIGAGEDAVKTGGKLVLYRHEFTYHNPTPIAIDVSDGMTEEEITERVKRIEGFSYNYIGRELNLEMVAIRSTSKDPDRFKSAVEKVAEVTKLPLILCSLNPDVMKAALT
jgi:acetyl-CoA decarbonylase/synthase complex subunit gamma